jgi:hypothetical protein
MLPSRYSALHAEVFQVGAGGQADGLDTFDAKRLDQGFGQGVSLQDLKKTRR